VDSILWWGGALPQDRLWKLLQAHDHVLFETARSAGQAYYCGKKKELITCDYSVGLNLMGRPEDGPLLSAGLLDNSVLGTYYTHQHDNEPLGYDLIMASTVYADAINSALSATRKVSAIPVTYRKHDTAVPFVVKPIEHAHLKWIEYAVAQMGT
jgi:hypothetical protein